MTILNQRMQIGNLREIKEDSLSQELQAATARYKLAAAQEDLAADKGGIINKIARLFNR